MLTFPEVLTHKGVVVFPDDEDPNLFYRLQGVPRLRMMQGKPVFRALFWTDEGDGDPNAVRGLLGAMLNFDVDLAIPDDISEQIRELIESTQVREARQRIMERDERERLERMAKARGERFDPSNLVVPQIRDVRFGSVRVTEGKVVLLEEGADGGAGSPGSLVEWASAGGPPSMIADNNAAFALRLSPTGAAIWHKALEDNSAAIGVRFDMKIQSRLPSLQIHVWAGSFQSDEITRKAERTVENRDQGCSDIDVEKVDVTEITSTLLEEGLVNIEVTKGAAQISDEHVSQLRTVAIDMMSERIKEILKSRLRGLTEEERKSSLINTVSEEVTSFSELRFSQRDVVNWPVAPQATLTEFLGQLDADERRSLSTVVDLSDPIVSTLEVPVSVSADWTAEPKIANVTVTVFYDAAGEQGVKEIVMTAQKHQETLTWRRVRNASERIRYEAKAFLVGAADPVQLPGGTSNGSVTVTVPILGRYSAKFTAHPNTFNAKGTGEISGVQIDYRYKTPDATDHRSGSLVITPEQLETGVELMQTTFRHIDAPLQVKTTFFRASETAIDGGDEQTLWMPLGQGNMTIRSPWPDSLRIAARVNAVTGLQKVLVEIQHEDTDTGFTSDGNLELDSDGDWEGRTNLVQARKEAARFRYRYTVVGNEQLTRGPWNDAEGDQQLVIPVLGVTLRTVQLRLGQDFDIAIVKMRYRDTGRDFECMHEFFITSNVTDPIWLVPRSDANDDNYRMSMLLIRPDGSEVSVAEASFSGTNLLLRAPASIDVPA